MDNPEILFGPVQNHSTFLNKKRIWTIIYSDSERNGTERVTFENEWR
jgi:hypothetical protein